MARLQPAGRLLHGKSPHHLLRSAATLVAAIVVVSACGTPASPAPAASGPATEAPGSQAPATQAPASQAAASKDTMIIGIPGTPPGIDPDTQSAPQMWTIGAQLYGQSGMRWGQTQYTAQQSVADPNKVPGFWVANTDMTTIQPGLVESCTLTPDGGKITLKLRQGAKSAVGNEFTSDDVMFGIQRSAATKAIGYFFAGVGGAQDPAQWKAIDKYTVEVTKQDASMYNLCGLLTHLGAAPSWIMDSVEVKKHMTADDPQAAQWINTQGSWFGPYYITDWEAGKQVVLQANPNWWGDPLAIKKIIYQVIPESANRLALLKAGKVDLIEGISPDEAAALDGQPGVRPVAVQSNKQFFAVMDESKPPFNDPKVRQALNLSVDRQGIVDSVYKGLGYPYQGFIPVTFPGFEEYHGFDFSLDKAKQLLAEAGYPDGFKTELSYAAGNPEEEQIAIIWQTSLAQIGIDVALKKLPTAAISNLVFQKNANFAFWQDAPFLPDPVFSLMLWYASFSPAQFNHFQDQKVDDGVSACLNVTPGPDRIKCASDLATYISTVAPLVNIAAPYFIYAVSDKVSGANFNFGLSYVVETMAVAP
jgi:peptide/nickel transport system substrate-binding protein